MTPAPITAQDWYELVQSNLPELSLPNFSAKSILFCLCEDLAHAADSAHSPPQNEDFLQRLYGTMRWTLHRTEDRQLLGWFADWFFDTLLDLETAKTACIDYLNWADVEVLIAHYTTEPLFDDEENFAQLCEEWKRRNEAHQLLPEPQLGE